MLFKDVRFPIEKELNYEIIQTEPVLLGKSTRLVICGKYIVFLRGRSEGLNLFSVFDLTSGNYIGDFGSFGRGPGEFPAPDVQNAVSTEDGFAFFDIIKGLVYVNIEELIKGKSFVRKQVRLPGELYSLNDAFLINDSVIIGMPYMGNADYMYVRLNYKTLHTEYFGEYPDIFVNKSTDELWAAFWRHSCVNLDGTRLVSFFDSQKMLRIYSQSGTLVKERVMETQEEYFSERYRRKYGLTHYYKAVKSTDKYIYALCYGTQKKNFLKTNPVIEVWDWDGEPIARFQMANSILTFDVTLDNKRIYCVDNQATNKFFVYNIESFLK